VDENEKSHLDDDYITPCGGTKNVGYIASLFLGQEVRPVILLDGDQAGRDRNTALLRELYSGQEKAVLLLSDVLGLQNLYSSVRFRSPPPTVSSTP
jgi:hypothetical protein